MRQHLYTLTQLEEAINSSLCFSDVCKELGISVCSFNYDRIKKLSAKHEIDLNHFDITLAQRRGKKKYTDEEIFCEKSSYSRQGLRKAVIRRGFYKSSCEECGQADAFNGKPLVLELDHINGKTNDNRKENLRWLCPNCHSQTETYRRRTTL